MLFPRPLRAAGVAAALSLVPASLAAAATPGAPAADDAHAARAGDTVVTWAELDQLLLDRYALSQRGREALLHLVKSRLLEVLAEESGLEVSERRIDERIAELEREMQKSGDGRGGLEQLLRRQGLSRATFRHYMRLAMVQETLARRALGIPADGPISGEQQEAWLEGVIAQRGLQERPAPWEDGLVCSVGGLEIRRPELLVHLRGQIDPPDVRDSCYQMLLRKRMLARMPDLAPQALERAVSEEIQRRRNDVMADPRYKGVAYEQLLQSQGIRIEAWPRDPAVQVAALARLWVERSYGAEELKRVYSDEREYFDGLFGEALEVRAIFLKAGKFKNDLMPRTWEEAERELDELGQQVQSAARFEEAAGEVSEDAATSAKGGSLGWLTRAGGERNLQAKAAVFAHLDQGRFDPDGDEDDRRRLLGPVRTASGCMLLWLGRRRPAPAWETMIVHVHTELRRRFVDDCLQRDAVVTWLDAD